LILYKVKPHLKEIPATPINTLSKIYSFIVRIASCPIKDLSFLETAPPVQITLISLASNSSITTGIEAVTTFSFGISLIYFET